MSQPFTDEELLEDLELGWISRYCDDKEIALQKQNRVFFQISGAGHEALLTGLARHLRPGRDWFFPYYRDRALVLGLGVSATDVLMQSVGAAADPASGGRQMPCHWSDPARHIVSQTSATGSQCLPAVGCAEAGRYLQGHPAIHAASTGDEITYVSLGEGTTSQGEFWEALNSATTLRLPTLFVVADNGWAISVPASDQHPTAISRMVNGFDGLRIERIDGCDYAAVRSAAESLTAHLRSGSGPVLLHASVTRPYSHSAADTQSKYRTEADLADEAERDPLLQMERLAVSLGVVDEQGVLALRERAKAHVDAAAAEALAAPLPDPTTVTRHVVGTLPQAHLPSSVGGSSPVASQTADRTEPGDELVTMADSINRVLHELMADDERIRVFGEDVADAPTGDLDEVPGKGGVFGTTLGLQRAFGADRCFNSPLAEANIVGRAIGQAVRGLRPFAEVQFFDYVWTAMQQIKTEAATMRWRSNGSWSVPMVLRIPIGGYLTGGAIWHSQSGESIFTHVPGLLVAMPSRAADAVGLLRTAAQCEDPVLFLEHKHLYRQPYARDPYPDPDFVVPFGQGTVRRPGSDLTIVTWGATVQKSIDAADAAAVGGVEVEVIDLRTLVPWDQQLVADSVARTGRLLVVHEDIQTGGFGAEIAAWAADALWDHLTGPISRVGALDTHVAYAPVLEDIILPQTADIAAAIAATARS